MVVNLTKNVMKISQRLGNLCSSAAYCQRWLTNFLTPFRAAYNQGWLSIE